MVGVVCKKEEENDENDDEGEDFQRLKGIDAEDQGELHDPPDAQNNYVYPKRVGFFLDFDHRSGRVRELGQDGLRRRHGLKKVAR